MTPDILPVSYTHLDVYKRQEIHRRVLKCPEIIVNFNTNITVTALVDTGSAINGMSEEWFNQNKQYLSPYEELPMTNTLILSAVGNKSKLIREQNFMRYL